MVCLRNRKEPHGSEQRKGKNENRNEKAQSCDWA